MKGTLALQLGRGDTAPRSAIGQGGYEFGGPPPCPQAPRQRGKRGWVPAIHSIIAAALLHLPTAANAQAPQCRTEATALVGVPADAKVTAHRGRAAVFFAQAAIDTGLDAGEIDLTAADTVLAIVFNGTLDLLFFQSNGCQFWDARGRATVLPLILQAMGTPA